MKFIYEAVLNDREIKEMTALLLSLEGIKIGGMEEDDIRV
jgi:hypothetical protein